MEEKTETSRTSVDTGRRAGGFDVPARHVLVACKVANSFVGALMDGSLPLAITVMVGRRAASVAASNGTLSADVCPGGGGGGGGATPGASPVQQEQEGQFDWDELTQSVVTNAATYGSLLTVLLGARLVELWSPKKLLVYSCFFYTALHMAVPAFARWSVYALVASRVAYGFILAPSSSGVIALMAAWFPPDERQLLNSIMNSVVSLGSIASTSLSGYLISEYGWELVFYLYGGLHLATNLLYVFLVYDTPQEHPRISAAERSYLARCINKAPKMSLPLPWLQMIKCKPLWAHISAVVGITWIKFIFTTELPTYLKKMLHYNTVNTGYVTSGIHATAWFAELSFGVISRWIRRKRCLSQLTTYKIFNAIAMLGPVATLVAVAQAGCDAPLTVALLMLHHGVAAAFMAGSVLNYMDLGLNFAPTLSAFTSTVAGAVAIASPTFAGALTNNQETLTAWSKIFYVSAVVSALPYVIFFVFGSTDEQPWNKPENLVGRRGSFKQQSPSDIFQATSSKLQAPSNKLDEQVAPGSDRPHLDSV
ncbi:putative inorganic phosphate cotransporter isoform X2 [Bacillus rossius redtenbacheri]|uniref:putative inorganic phosphate cotransporter isoform X2 n=1 Tax=Bacillus rossius redtenbacheri TaxID=93214 RepID=UPI002FDCDD6C